MWRPTTRPQTIISTAFISSLRWTERKIHPRIHPQLHIFTSRSSPHSKPNLHRFLTYPHLHRGIVYIYTQKHTSVYKLWWHGRRPYRARILYISPLHRWHEAVGTYSVTTTPSRWPSPHRRILSSSSLSDQLYQSPHG